MQKFMSHVVAGLACVVLAACGGGDGSSLQPNEARLYVDSGPHQQSVNVPYVNVIVCVPGTNDCQTIDHVLVDTGSSGLRLFASAMQKVAGRLPSSQSAAGALGVCQGFAGGYVWSAAKKADVRIGGELASAIPIAVIGEATFPAAPAPCVEDSGNRNAAPLLANVANGIVAGCKPTTVPLAQQISNPVAFFKTNNNGVVFQLPTPSSNRAQSLTGKLIFGIGTQDNNQLGNARNYRSIPELNHTFEGRINGVETLVRIDSGADSYVYGDSAPICQSAQTPSNNFFCPPAARTNSVDLMVNNQFVHVLDFTVENATDFYANPAGDAVFSHLGSPMDSFNSILGLPFFYGRAVFIANDGKQTPGGAGPYVAF